MSAKTSPIAKFRIGRIMAMPSALARLTQDDILHGLQRHQAGDWGDVCDDDREANECALTEGTRLWSIYHSAAGVKFWIIAEADRSATTVLLPKDY